MEYVCHDSSGFGSSGSGPTPIHPETLRLAAISLFSDIFSNNSSSILLSHFSRTQPVTIQHAPANDPYPQSSRLTGLNAVRSYFDLLSTHWHRTEMKIHSTQIIDGQQLTASTWNSNPNLNSKTGAQAINGTTNPRVILTASVQWIWKCSGQSWREDFTCILEYDDFVKVTSFVVRTDSVPEATCVLRARDPVSIGGPRKLR